jgi:hypothetical protein
MVTMKRSPEQRPTNFERIDTNGVVEAGYGSDDFE